MGEALLTVKNLNAWYNVDSEKTLSQLLIPCTLKRAKSRYSNEKMILSDFSFALAAHEVAGLIGLNGRENHISEGAFWTAPYISFRGYLLLWYTCGFPEAGF